MDMFLEDYLDETVLRKDSLNTGKVSADDMPLREVYLGLAAELLCSFGVIGETPIAEFPALLQRRELFVKIS